MDEKEMEKRLETSADRLVYFSAERTLLTWVRAGLSMMTVGFVVDRFNLILKEANTQFSGYDGDALSKWIGVLFILTGVATNLIGAARYIHFEIRYHRNVDTRPGYGMSLGVFLTIAAAVLGIAVALFLTRVTELYH